MAIISTVVLEQIMTAQKATSKKSPPKDVDSYLKAVPAEAVSTLQALRAVIQAAAPEASEVISYGVPTYMHKGALVAFAATPKHCAFYVMSPGPIVARKEALKAYDTAPSAIRFPAGKPLPKALVTSIVKERIAENEKKKQGKKA
jgi:uncharacterized protein YdhG (YjbR/CyaY superfamily)